MFVKNVVDEGSDRDLDAVAWLENVNVVTHAISDPGVHTRARTGHMSRVRDFVGATPIYA